MLQLLLRIAVLGSALALAFNVVSNWVRVLLGPKPAKALPPAPLTPAETMVEDATRHLTQIEVDIAGLEDAEMWRVTAGFTSAVGRLNAAVLGDPNRYRQARRHLGQILPAARDVVGKFASFYATSRPDAARDEFLSLATELTAAYDRAAQHYLRATEDDILAEADVLRDLIERAKR